MAAFTSSRFLNIVCTLSFYTREIPFKSEQMFIVLLKQMLCHKHRQQSWLILRKKKYFDNFIKKNKNGNLYLVQFCTFPFFFLFSLFVGKNIRTICVHNKRISLVLLTCQILFILYKFYFVDAF